MGGIKHMKRNLFTAWILSLALPGVASAQGAASSAETGDHYTQGQLKQLARGAHAPEEYRTLASYYGERQRIYLQKAADEKAEWERRSQNVMGVLAKYPRPVDSAKNLYEYYMAEAADAAKLEAKYSALAAPDAPVSAMSR
jgi:hypothetical protein